MSESKDQTIALNVRPKPSESSAHPRATNYTNVGVAQGIAYVDFGFIEPTLLAAIAKTTKDGQAALKGLEGHLITRVALGVDVLGGCISRFSTYWSVCAMHGSRSGRRRIGKKLKWGAV